MRRLRRLPLGVDVGTSRIRVASAAVERDGTLRLEAVSSRDIRDNDPEMLGTLLEELAREAGGRERRCVGAVGVPAAALRSVHFPKMTWAERRNAAQFEVRRFVGWDVDSAPTNVRIAAVDGTKSVFALGAIRDNEMRRRLAVIRCAGLRAVAMDYDGLALRRALPMGDAIIDIGADRSTLHVYGAPLPRSLHVDCGGDHVTRGIAKDLAIDEATAERRKRILGPAGAGGKARDAIVAALARALEGIRARSRVARVVLTGNGARLPGLASALQHATGVHVALPVSPLLEGEAYPEDVIRSAAPDWTMAVGLAAWGTAAA